MIERRAAGDRGHADHGWLESWHSFSFADYRAPRHLGFGPLRVINDDRIAPGTGFGAHGHRDMEILTYVLDGALEHHDSMGHRSVLRPGDVQYMNAGTGVRHSEFNASHESPLHLLQIWIEPPAQGLAPAYAERHFDLAARRGCLRLIAGPEATDDALRLHQDARLHAGLFDGDEQAMLALAPGRRAYVHLARGALTVNDVVLAGGDALKLSDTPRLELRAASAAEVLVFDLPGAS